MARYDENTTTLGQLLDDPEVVAIFDKHAPGVASNPMIGMAKGMTVSAAMGMAGSAKRSTPCSDLPLNDTCVGPQRFPGAPLTYSAQETAHGIPKIVWVPQEWCPSRGKVWQFSGRWPGAPGCR